MRSGSPSWSESNSVTTQRSWRIQLFESWNAGTTCAWPSAKTGRACSADCAPAGCARRSGERRTIDDSEVQGSIAIRGQRVTRVRRRILNGGAGEEGMEVELQ